MDTTTLLIEGRAAAQSGRGARIRKLSGLTQEEMARLVGVTPAAISRGEAADRVPSGKTAAAYAKTLRRLEELTGQVPA